MTNKMVDGLIYPIWLVLMVMLTIAMPAAGVMAFLLALIITVKTRAPRGAR